MSKAQYLSNEHVSSFAKWFGENLNTDRLAHKWTSRRPPRIEANFTSVYDAFENYHWRFPALDDYGIVGGTSFVKSAAALAKLKALLIGAKTDKEALHAAVGVMLWGGVGAGNIRWLQAHEKGILQMLQTTAAALSQGNLSDPVLKSRTLRFNAGMTKVYSLMVPGFVIYDSRVAAAIAWAVARYCAENELESVPSGLAFQVRAAKEAPDAAHPKSRDPSQGRLRFSKLPDGPEYAAWNMKASWLLEAALAAAGDKSPFKVAARNGGDGLRALEAALFMIGYDLGTRQPADQGEAIKSTPSTASEKSAEADAVTCFTLARQNQFAYRLVRPGLRVEGQPPYSTQVLQQVVDALRGEFADSDFPLANSRDRVANNTAEEGFGTVFAATTGRNAQAASRLAAVLVDLGILRITATQPALRLRLAPSPVQIDSVWEDD